MSFIKQLDISGSLAENLSDTGDISLNEDVISGFTYLADDIKEGEFTNELNINGSLSEGISDAGMLSLLDKSLVGTTILPKVLDKTAIHYDTKDNWDRQTFLQTEKGHLYIYKDATYNYVNGKKVIYAGLKIGDGNSYLIDMPFLVFGSDHDVLEAHIKNWAVHVSRLDRVNWDEKVSVSIVQENEELIFMK